MALDRDRIRSVRRISRRQLVQHLRSFLVAWAVPDQIDAADRRPFMINQVIQSQRAATAELSRFRGEVRRTNVGLHTCWTV